MNPRRSAFRPSILLAALCLFPALSIAQFLRPQPATPPPPALSARTPLPHVQTVAGRLTPQATRALLPGTWLLFKRVPTTGELSALNHAPAKGVLVMHLPAAPTVADCVRLTHAPKGWRHIMILPPTVRKGNLAGFRHLRQTVEVVIPDLQAAQHDFLLQPYTFAVPSSISQPVCGYLVRGGRR